MLRVDSSFGQKDEWQGHFKSGPQKFQTFAQIGRTLKVLINWSRDFCVTNENS